MLDSCKAEADAVVAAIGSTYPKRDVDAKIRVMIAKAFPVINGEVFVGCWKVQGGYMRGAYQWSAEGKPWQLVVTYNPGTRRNVKFVLSQRGLP